MWNRIPFLALVLLIPTSRGWGPAVGWSFPLVTRRAMREASPGRVSWHDAAGNPSSSTCCCWPQKKVLELSPPTRARDRRSLHPNMLLHSTITTSTSMFAKKSGDDDDDDMPAPWASSKSTTLLGRDEAITEAIFTETPLRSAVKAIFWRIFSGSITLLSTWLLAGKITEGAKMILAGLVPKASAMFLADRLMNTNRAGRNASSGADTVTRSLAKVLIWRAASLVLNLALALFFFRNFALASKIVSLDGSVKAATLFGYERIWAHIGWGIKSYHPKLLENQGSDDSLPSSLTSSSPPIEPRIHRPTSTSLLATSTSVTEGDKMAPEVSDENDMEHPSSSFSWENQWFPVLPLSYLEEQEIATQPISVHVLGRPLVVWRNLQDPTRPSWSIMEDICPHRKSPLSTGQVVAGGCRLQCRYHGYEFDDQGKCRKIPMQTTEVHKADDEEGLFGIAATSFPSRTVGGLLWVYLGSTRKLGKEDDLPPIPASAIPSPEQIQGADWMFNRNPISYVSMMENTFDPAHAPFTHQGMVGFAGMSFSPDDTVPMASYRVLEQPSVTGFSLQHSPYQQSTARLAPNSTTTRSFYPPTTVSVSSPPFFKTKMWFVPAANAYETNVLSFFKMPESRWVHWASRIPALHRCLKDTAHTLQYIGEWNYRFLSQDRITMQGQDERKAGSERIFDLTPTPSDVGVATFQKWLHNVAGLPPLPGLNQPDFSRDMSMWESHGKYCPKCQRSMRRLTKVKGWAQIWSKRSLGMAGGSALLHTLITILEFRASSLVPWIQTIGAKPITMVLALNLLMVSMAWRALGDWCQVQERRMYVIGAQWPPGQSVFGSFEK